MSRIAKKIHFPRTRLSDLAARPGGIPGDEAIETATSNLQEIRGESERMIERLIQSIETVAHGAIGGRLSESAMNRILAEADQVVTLAGTFEYDALGTAARSLCDVTDGLSRQGAYDAAPVAVHARALRLLTPGGRVMSEAEIASVLGELAKVLAHFHITPLGEQDLQLDAAPT